jgi:hypothetical protein
MKLGVRPTQQVKTAKKIKIDRLIKAVEQFQILVCRLSQQDQEASNQIIHLNQLRRRA